MNLTHFTRLAIVGATAVALSACNPAGDEKRGEGQTNEPVNIAQDAAGAATGLATAAVGSVSTQAFVTDAAIAGMYEIESSKLALARSKNAQVRKAAEQIIKDHTAADTKLKSIVAGGTTGATLPTAMDERRKGMLDNLKGASDADFDDRYLDQQTMAHHEALALFNGYKTAGENAELKAFAASTAPALEVHAKLVTSLDRESVADDEAGATKH